MPTCCGGGRPTMALESGWAAAPGQRLTSHTMLSWGCFQLEHQASEDMFAVHRSLVADELWASGMNPRDVTMNPPPSALAYDHHRPLNMNRRLREAFPLIHSPNKEKDLWSRTARLPPEALSYLLPS